MGIVQEDTELIGETAVKKVGRVCHLLHDTMVNLHNEAEFDFCIFFYPPNAFEILRDTVI
jgi:hypothetical protein